MTRLAQHKHVYKRLRAYTWLYSIFAAGVALAVLFLFVFHTVRIDGDGMADTIKSGDIVLFSSIAKHITMPTRGSVVAYKNESGATETGRIIALPGETVAVREGSVYIGGHLLHEDYATPAAMDMETVALGAECFFVLPDDRSMLMLFRENVGALVVPFERIVGTAAIRVAPWGRIALFG